MKGLVKKIVVVLVVAIVGIAATTDKGKTNRYFEISKNLEIFTNIYKEINTYYVDDIEPSDLMRTGIDAMLKSLDPYTNYISESQIENFRLQTRGEYGGIGALIRQIDDYVVITEPYEGFPADKAGLKAGDKIIEIDGKSAKGKTTDQVSSILKGSPKTSIKIKIERPGETKPLDINLTRAKVTVANVPYFGMVNDEVGYITLTTFTQNAGKNVEKALKSLKKDNPKMKGVIFDLRGNGGGLLNEAINVSNIFVPKGKEVVTTRGKIKEWDRSFRTLNNPVDLDIPLIVLIDGGSASASEIVSGVIQDLDRGVLVGQNSFGKGLVQNTRDVGYNSKVKLTTAKYYIPSGRCIQGVNYKNGKPVDVADSLRTVFKTTNGRKVYDGKGVLPDVEVEFDKYGDVVGGLMRKHLVFDYATEYALKHKTIDAAKTFALSDADYQNFLKFIEGKDYGYDTDSEKAVKALRKKAEEEKYLSAISADIKQIESKIKVDKKKDLNRYKAQIVDLLEREIVARYYYQKGRVEVGLKNDKDIKEAVSLLANPTKYEGLLK